MVNCVQLFSVSLTTVVFMEEWRPPLYVKYPTVCLLSCLASTEWSNNRKYCYYLQVNEWNCSASHNSLYRDNTNATCSHKIVMIFLKFFSLLTIICLKCFSTYKIVCFFLLRVKNILIPNFFTHLPKRKISHELVIAWFQDQLSPSKCYHNIIWYQLFTYCKLIRGWELIKFSPFSASVVCSFCKKTINANNN